MSDFAFDRDVVEYHKEIAKRDVMLMTEASHDSPDYNAALLNAENRLRFWMNVKINDDEVMVNK